MKPWMGVVVVILTLAVGAYLVAPRTDPPTGAGASASPGEAPKFATITRGDRVTIEDHLADGRFTVVEFSADW